MCLNFMEIIVEKKFENAFRMKAVNETGEEMGHVYLYLIYNDLHKDPYAYIEDLFVEEEFRKQGVASKLIEELLIEAEKYYPYKAIATSRMEREHVHAFYEKRGLRKHGYVFRTDRVEFDEN